MKVHEDMYVAYILTVAVLLYNTMIYYLKLKSNYLPLLRDLTPLNEFTTSSGAVCRTDIKMTWIPHAHRKPK